MPSIYSQYTNMANFNILITNNVEKKEEYQSYSLDSNFICHSSNLFIVCTHNEEKGQTIFTGIAENNIFKEIFNGGLPQKIYDFLIRAINNRTIERNYFRLYGDLLSGDISEQEFQQEIEEHESDYVLENNIIPSEEDIKLAIQLSEHVKDVQSSEDLSSLFSFNSIAIDKILLK